MIEAIKKLLEERPGIDGIALPGMPSGSPGMPGPKRASFTIYQILDGQYSEFMTVRAEKTLGEDRAEKTVTEEATRTQLVFRTRPLIFSHPFFSLGSNDPQTTETIQIPAKKAPKFRPGRGLREKPSILQRLTPWSKSHLLHAIADDTWQNIFDALLDDPELRKVGRMLLQGLFVDGKNEKTPESSEPPHREKK